MTELAFSVAETVIEKLGSLAKQEISLAWNFASDLKKLQLIMSNVKAVLLNAEEKQAEMEGLSVWLGQLKDVFYDAMDVLDELECEDLRKQVMKKHGSTGRKVRSFFSSSNMFAFRFEMGHRIKEIRERLEEIAKVRAQFHLEERLDDKLIVHREREMTHSFVRDSDVIGRADDKQKIIDLLMHPGDDGNVSVISIVGIGGLGKTTLAQWVYNDERVANKFDSRIWVCVSENFNVLKLAKEIRKSALKSTGGGISETENMSMDEVQAGLRIILKEKRFFIVLDDVWNEDRNKWIGLKNLLTEGAKGSKIVVTTRSHKVASVMAPGPIHNIEGLPEDHCLSLLLKWAFSEGEEKQYPKLVEIGKQIVKKCKGVPLAVRTLGSLLYSKIDEHDWISIRDNEIWKLEQKHDDILPALTLSYNQLPSLEALPSSISNLKHLRYLNLGWNNQIKKLPNSICDLQNLETLILRGCEELEELPRDIRIQRLTALRKLDFRYCERLMSLPRGMKHLTALKSLEIWNCKKLNLMEGEDYPTSLRSFTIYKLPKLVALPQWLIQSANTLQFLRIFSCDNLAAFPEWLPNLSSLQKLEIRRCPKLSSLPEGMGRLTSLRDLKIKCCPELSKNCEREVGMDWHKIAHVPLVDIDSD
uniref:Disease resistance protein RGA3 n=1 Tax=Fagus sylvatica TaxID=28930 RepID=A0A2N9J8B0_FAGSY